MTQLIRIQKDSVILPLAPTNPPEFVWLILKDIYQNEKQLKKPPTSHNLKLYSLA